MVSTVFKIATIPEIPPISGVNAAACSMKSSAGLEEQRNLANHIELQGCQASPSLSLKWRQVAKAPNRSMQVT